MAGAGGTETLAAARAATAGPQRQRAVPRHKLVTERVSTLPAFVSTATARNSSNLVQRHAADSLLGGDDEPHFFSLRALIPSEDEVREGLGLATEDNGKEDTFKVVEIPRQFLQKLHIKGFKLKIANASLRRLFSGAVAGAVSRTAVAPLETIRTHLMVGNGHHSVVEVFDHVMKTEGWQGLFRGNGVNVIRVAPSKAIELFAYDTVKTLLAPKPGETSHLIIPASTVAGATAGVCSTLCTYPLELLKTRLTIQRGVYNNLLHAFIKICKEEGPRELYRGLSPSLIGVVPYAAINYFAYDTLRKTYRKLTKQEKIGNLETLLMGSAAGAISSTATFPLEVARKQMQVGALSGRRVYNNMFHALSSILEQQGPEGLYRGLGASCLKLIPAAGISFMCYEACKILLVEDEDSRQQ
jgi:solute carrier family 25 phosphate transporter 23/24/25/41